MPLTLDDFKQGVIKVLVIFSGIGLLIAPFLLISHFIGNNDNFYIINPVLTKYWVSVLYGAAMLFFSLFLYVSNNSSAIHTIIMIVACFSLAFAFSAFAIGLIRKN